MAREYTGKRLQTGARSEAQPSGDQKIDPVR
jgi:hypothetical protein